jgi:hypothetical protein
MLRGDRLVRLINKKPEKMQITWTSARSWFPGVVTVDELEIRGQTRRIQWYIAADDVHARISLLRLPLKRVHLSSAHTAGIDFRLRRRLDPPAKEGAEGAPPEIRGSEHFPEIPGFTNPPDPKPRTSTPEELKSLDHPLEADVDGPIGRGQPYGTRGEGRVGAMTYRTRLQEVGAATKAHGGADHRL